MVSTKDPGREKEEIWDRTRTRKILKISDRSVDPWFETNLDFATLKVGLVVSFVLGTIFGSLLVHHFDSFWGSTNDKIPWSLFHRYLTNSRLN